MLLIYLKLSVLNELFSKKLIDLLCHNAIQ